MAGSPDFTLLAAWRDGDDDAGQRLLRRHFTRLYLFFSNKVAGDVSDLVQQTMLGCVEGRDRVKEDGSFKAFLLGVARHRLYDHYRARCRDPLQPIGETPMAKLGPSATSLVARRQNQRQLLAALRGIPLELQIVLELHYWEELSTADLAQVLGVPQGTVKSRLRRAREALAASLAAISDGAVQDTTDYDLERWARSIREEVHVQLGGAPEDPQ
ncbi:MAG: sigma-70 family RNA polymerase sigma factor [Deltaproteobacteria bacterium]|nr:sigma-70 family RNA polymerase sigma factor [Deltaproteobacteria bacterium]